MPKQEPPTPINHIALSGVQGINLAYDLSSSNGPSAIMIRTISGGIPIDYWTYGPITVNDGALFGVFNQKGEGETL